MIYKRDGKESNCRRCWNCKRLFTTEELGLNYCPTCSAITTGSDNIIQEKPEIPQRETACLDRFCTARIPCVERSEKKECCGPALKSSPMNPAQLAAQREAEQGRSSLQRISQLLNDSCALLYNARLLVLEADREISRMQRQPTPPRSDSQ